MTAALGLDEVDWADGVTALRSAGWWRLPSAIPRSATTEIRDAAPPDWRRLPDEEGGVRQAGWSVHAEVSTAAPIVRALASSIRTGLAGAAAGEAELPAFNHAQWGRADRGEGFITSHRDPPGATGVIAIVTLDGATTFRVWDEDSDSDRAHDWQTAAGDLVVLRGHGWPTSDARCPRHEVEPIADGSRAILTLRHNRLGFGGSYFT